MAGKADASEKICPICGGPNACAMACGRPPHGCWCVEQNVPQALLEQLPDDAKNTRCICADCIQTFQKTGRVRQHAPDNGSLSERVTILRP